MNVFGIFRNAREYLTPILQQSAFIDRGMLTPEEFVIAGDHLVHTCPTWIWCSGDERLRKSYLPPDKQFLVTRSVPSYRRAVDLMSEPIQESVLEVSETGNENDNWYSPSTNNQNKLDNDDEVLIDNDGTINNNHHLNTETKQKSKTSNIQSKQEISNEYEDMEDYEDESLTLDTNTEIKSSNNQTNNKSDESSIIVCRRYDVYICYDNYYRTPRVYLFGYDDTPLHKPLSSDRILEDIIQDYVNKTVTIESHPHFNTTLPTASIHPCQHASAMKRILDQMIEPHSNESQLQSNEQIPLPTVDQYLFIFLKFLQSVIPTIEYDYTVNVQIQGRR